MEGRDEREVSIVLIRLPLDYRYYLSQSLEGTNSNQTRPLNDSRQGELAREGEEALIGE